MEENYGINRERMEAILINERTSGTFVGGGGGGSMKRTASTF